MLVLVTAAPSSIAGAQEEVSLPAAWEHLPAPKTMVRLDTPHGSFALPMGYLSDWITLKDAPVKTTISGQRVFTGAFAVDFVFPVGRFDVNYPWNTAVRDGHGETATDRSVVWIENSKLPDTRGQPDLEVEALSLYPPGHLHFEPLIGDPKLIHVYRGVAAGSGPGNRIGVVVSCTDDCHLYMYLEKHNLELKGVMLGKLRDRALDVAELTQRLFDAWYIATPSSADRPSRER